MKRLTHALLAITLLALAPVMVLLSISATADVPMQPWRGGPGWKSTPTAQSDSLMFDPGGHLTLSIDSIAVDADNCPSPVLRVLPSERMPASAMLRWRRSGDAATYSHSDTLATRTTGAESELYLPNLALHPAWTGRVVALQWRLSHDNKPPAFAVLREPWVGVPRATGADRCRMLWRQWWWVEPLALSSVNSIRAPHILGRAPATWTALGLAFALGACWLFATIKRRPMRAKSVFAAVLIAWFILDMRRMPILGGGSTAESTGLTQASPMVGASRLIDDAYAIARRVLPPGAIYAVAGGNLPTAAGDSRLRYLLSPTWVQINVDPLHPRVSPDRTMFVLVLDRSAIRLDVATGRLEVEGLPGMVAAPWGSSDQVPFVVQRVDR